MVPAKETLLTAVQATNFTNYMYEVGVDGFTRKIACSLYPTATNELVDGQIKISTSSTFKSGENVFNLGEPFTETTADGREVTTTATRTRCVWTLPAAACPPSRAGSSRRTG